MTGSRRTGAIVLAAGESRRMGTPKMMLPWQNGTVLGSVIEVLLRSPVDEVVVVLGHRAELVAQALARFASDPRVRFVLNERYQGGMLTSIQCGVRALGRGDVLVALGDQPLITPDVVAALMSVCQGGIAIPVYNGRRGHPLAIDSSLVPPLLELPAEAGLRGLLQAYPERISTVEVASQGVLIDLDTPADYLQHRPAPPDESGSIPPFTHLISHG